MKLSALKEHLSQVSELTFLKENGDSIPKHFHITEVGQIDKKFIDCGGTIRQENLICLQLWESIDFWHRLTPEKLLDIIKLSESKLGIQDFEIEVEYQAESVSKFGLLFQNGSFLLSNKTTACLASDSCGIPSIGAVVESCCTPNGGCC